MENSKNTTITLAECLQDIRNYEGECGDFGDKFVAEVQKIKNVETKFQELLQKHPWWAELASKKAPEYLIKFGKAEKDLELLTLDTYSDPIPVIAITIKKDR